MFSFLIFAGVLIATCAAADVVPSAGPSPSCLRRNGYIKQEGQCDTYLECKNYVAVQMSCPDGLHYDPSVAWPNYPCGYPMDVKCIGASQPAIPSPDCPHQYGYFPSPKAAPNDCGRYRFCVDGTALELVCPAGLAFNPATSRCDWADNVASCDVGAFLGFKCPPPTYDENGDVLVTNHRYANNCYAFFSCQADGLPRLLSCDAGEAFDENTGRCEDADKVACRSDAIPVPI